jgi:hypothetical protein
MLLFSSEEKREKNENERIVVRHSAIQLNLTLKSFSSQLLALTQKNEVEEKKKKIISILKKQQHRIIKIELLSRLT